jgi:O-acetyl-ADP-ribose deacetylase (regulator of RNase III)
MDRIELIQGDITVLDVDAIVNAANARLIMGGGVAGAILKKGGWSIQAECDKIGGTFVGGAVITGAGRLKAKYVIHAVGPRMGEGDEEEKLRNATLNSLKIASEKRLKTVAFPAISTGIFGYPIKECARIMLNAANDYLKDHPHPEKVLFCLYDRASYETFSEFAKKCKKDLTKTS